MPVPESQIALGPPQRHPSQQQRDGSGASARQRPFAPGGPLELPGAASTGHSAAVAELARLPPGVAGAGHTCAVLFRLPAGARQLSSNCAKHAYAFRRTKDASRSDLECAQRVAAEVCTPILQHSHSVCFAKANNAELATGPLQAVRTAGAGIAASQLKLKPPAAPLPVPAGGGAPPRRVSLCLT